jgi:hypothetical protein
MIALDEQWLSSNRWITATWLRCFFITAIVQGISRKMSLFRQSEDTCINPPLSRSVPSLEAELCFGEILLFLHSAMTICIDSQTAMFYKIGSSLQVVRCTRKLGLEGSWLWPKGLHVDLLWWGRSAKCVEAFGRRAHIQRQLLGGVQVSSGTGGVCCVLGKWNGQLKWTAMDDVLTLLQAMMGRCDQQISGPNISGGLLSKSDAGASWLPNTTCNVIEHAK